MKVKKRILQKLLFAVALFFAITTLAWKSVEHYAAQVVVRIFEQGTNCVVHATNPSLELFPVRASLEDISIIAPHEKGGEGVYAKHLSIGLDLLELFDKTLNLRDLQITGAHIVSNGVDSSFIRLLRFVIPSVNDARPPKGSWSGHLVNLLVETDPAHPQQLELQFGDEKLSFNEVSFSIDDKNIKAEPFISWARAKSLTYESGLFSKFNFGKVSLDGFMGLGRIRFSQAQLFSLPSEVSNSVVLLLQGKGDLNFIGDNFYDLTVATEAPLAEMVRAIPALKKTPSGDVKATVQISGPMKEVQASGDAQLDIKAGLGAIKKMECYPIAGAFSFGYRHGAFYAEKIDLAGVFTQGNLDLSLASSLPLSGSLPVNLSDQNPFVAHCFGELSDYFSKTPSRSFGQGVISLEGELKPLNVKLAANTEPIVDKGIRALATISNENVKFLIEQQGDKKNTLAHGYEAHLEGQYSFTESKIYLERAIAKNYPLGLIAEVTFPFLNEGQQTFLAQSDLTRGVLNISLQRLAHDASLGNRMEGNLLIENVSVRDVPISKASANVNVQADTITFSDVAVNSEYGVLSGKIAVASLADIEGEGKFHFANLSSFAPWTSHFPSLTGELGGEFNLDGLLSAPELKAKLAGQLAFVDEPKQKHEILVELAANSDVLTLTGKGFDKAFELAGSFYRTETRYIPKEVHAQLRGFPVLPLLPSKFQNAYLKSPETEAKESKRGVVSATIDIKRDQLTKKEGEGKIEISDLILPGGDKWVDPKRPLELSLVDRRVKFDQVVLNNEGRELKVVGGVDLDSGWNAQIFGEWDVSTFSLPVPLLEQTSGTVHVDVNVQGETFNPNVQGLISLNDGTVSFKYKNAVIGIRGVELNARFENDQLLITNISGFIGNGEIKGNGLAYHLFKADERELAIQFSFSDTELEVTKNLSITARGLGKVEKRKGQPITLGGEISIVEAGYRETIDLGTILLKIREFLLTRRSRLEHAGPSSLDTADGPDLNLAINAPNDVRVSTSVFDAHLRGECFLTGKLKSPHLQGRIDILEGTYGFQASQFDIVSGQMQLNDSIQSLDPRINIVGESEVLSPSGQPYSIKMIVGGSVLRPSVNFVSNSGLSETELVAMMGIDANIDPFTLLKRKNVGGGIGRTPVSTVQSSMFGVSERLSAIAGFSSITLANSPSAITGEMTTKVVATRPITDATSLNVQSELTKTQESQITLDYMITPYISLSSGWQSYSNTNRSLGGEGAFVTGVQYKKTFPALGLLLQKR